MREELDKYCGDLAARIHACRSRQVAMMLTERICAELQGKRIKTSTVHRLQGTMLKLITSTFDENGKNRFLEEV